IVILDAQQHAAIERPSDAPDVDRIDDMPEMEVARRRRGEACNQRRGIGGRERCQRWTEQRIDNQEYVIPFLSPHDPFPPVAHALKDPNGLLAAGAALSPEPPLAGCVNS